MAPLTPQDTPVAPDAPPAAPPAAPPQNALASLTVTGPDGIEPGIGTSEFWVSLVTWVFGVIDATSLHHLSQAQEAAILVGVPLLYTLVRGVRKSLGA